MAKESTLTQIQKDSIDIVKFIFHIIVVDDDEPTYLDAVDLTDSQKLFFEKRIAEVAEGTQYSFIDRDHNSLAKNSLDLYSDDIFIDTSKTICNDFKAHHRGSMTDGAFIIATFKMLGENDGHISLIALIKMDQKKVLEYKLEDAEEGRKAKMREIADSFIESKDAVQKVAIIDTSDTFSWDILAKERKKTEGIAEYFQSFLHAQMKDTASILTRRTISEVSKWSKIKVGEIKEVPEFQERTSDYASYFKSRAVAYMNNNEGVAFNTDNFISHVFSLDEVSMESQVKIQSLSTEMKAHLATVGIDGQVFSPKPNSITKTLARTKKRTEEGVTIEWQGNPEDRGVKIEATDNNRQKITITTSNLVDMER